MILALAGGVGGAKLALGLSRILPPSELCIVVNTGDDFVHLGLHISPDIDTITYTLAGIANPSTGWGLANDTAHFMDSLGRLGGPTWFLLGDRDLATHVERTRLLSEGRTLGEVTQTLAPSLGVRHRVVPMSDDPVRTVIVSNDDRLAFQDYFVRLKAAPCVSAIEYAGAADALIGPAFAEVLHDPRLRGIIVCPSNPYLSIGPILAVPHVREALANRKCPAIAVSPIIGDTAVKGPAAKIMREIGAEPSATTVAQFYTAELIDCLLVDSSDAGRTSEIEALGIRAETASILMRSLDDREALARHCVGVVGA